MEEQSYKKHTQVVPMYHMVLFGLVVIAFIGSLVNLYRHIGDDKGRTTVVLLVIITLAMLLQFFFSRVFPLKAQDRAIRAEENLRHFAMTGKLLDRRLTIKQIIALRFASDEEFVDLARQAADQGLSMADIKKSVKHWRPDHDRV
jgi:L-cystine uptake protein TcyP (sodium:dicarboxylate symporter family)